MMNRILDRLLWVLLAGYIGFCVVAWTSLPDLMPVHFGVSGRVTSWMSRSPVLWFLPPLLCTGVIFLARAASEPAEAWNLAPEDVKRFHSLPVNARERIRSSAKESLNLLLLPLPVVFVILQVGMYMTAIERSPRMPGWIAVGLLTSTLVFLFLGRRHTSELKRLIRR